MTLPVFLVDSASLADDVIELTGAEGRHAAVVRRVRPGEHIMLTDGRGVGAECVIWAVAKGSLVAEVVDLKAEPEPVPRLVVVQALLKGGAGVTAVDLLAQVGVDVIAPWAAERSQVLMSNRLLERWMSTAREAAKQARRLRFPDITDPLSTAAVATLLSAAAEPLVLHESAGDRLRHVAVPSAGDIVLVVGPEGGLTDTELATMAAAGARTVQLGPTVLRASTAGAVAAAIVLSGTPRWR